MIILFSGTFIHLDDYDCSSFRRYAIFSENSNLLVELSDKTTEIAFQMRRFK